MPVIHDNNETINKSIVPLIIATNVSCYKLILVMMP